MELLQFIYSIEPRTLFWIVNILLFTSFIPQIILNYRLKSAAGLSDVMLLAYVNGHVAYLLYVYCLNLPAAYKVILPIGGIALLIIVAQRFYYALWEEIQHLIIIYAINIVLIAIAICLAFKYPHQVGHAAGWALFVLATLQQVPQALKIYREKSVKGFSLLFVTIVAMANVAELIGAILLKFPLQTILADIRSLIMCAIFYIQFWLYSSDE